MELYPVQLMSIGLGLLTFLASLGPAVVNLIITVFNRANVSIMFLFIFLSCVAFAATLPLEETFGAQPRERVKEIEGAEEGITRKVI